MELLNLRRFCCGSVYKGQKLILVKGENAIHQYFLLFPRIQNGFFPSGTSKSRYCVLKGKIVTVTVT